MPRVKAVSSNLLLYLLLALLFILPRLYQLSQYVTADENLWLRRSANFYFALAQGDLAHTFQRPHPGVMTTWAGSGGFLLAYPQYRGTGAGNLELDGEFHRLLAAKQQQPLTILVAGRSLVVLSCALVMLGAFFLLRQVFDTPLALLAYLLITFDPFYFSLSRLLHLDGLLTSFIFLSLSALLYYLLAGKKTTALLLSGAAAGFACLSKSPGMFLIPFTVLLVTLDHFRDRGNGTAINWSSWLRSILIWGLAGGMVFTLFWPAMWLDPIGTVKAIFSLAATYAEEGHLHLFYGQVGRVTFPWWYYPITFLWRTTPVIILGLLAMIPGIVCQWRDLDQPRIRGAIVVLLLYIVLFTAFMQIGEKRFDRYALPIYPPLILLAALGWDSIYRVAAGKFTCISKHIIYYSMLALVVAAQAAFLFSTSPYFISYYNPWMGGTSAAAQVMTIGWGEGLDQAARYLNSKPDSNKIKAFSTLSSGPFSYYFNGDNLSMVSENGWGAENAERLAQADYVLIYVSQWQRQLHQPLLQVLAGTTPEFVVTINGVDYVQVYNRDDIPPEDLQRLTVISP